MKDSRFIVGSEDPGITTLSSSDIGWMIVGGFLICLGLGNFLFLITYLGITMVLWKSRSWFTIMGFWVVSISIPLLLLERFTIPSGIIYIGSFLVFMGLVDTCMDKKYQRYALQCIIVFALFVSLFFSKVQSTRRILWYDTGTEPFIRIFGLAIVIICWLGASRADKEHVEKNQHMEHFILGKNIHDILYLFGGISLVLGLYLIEHDMAPIIIMVGAASMVQASKGHYFLPPVGYFIMLLFGLSGPRFPKYAYYSPIFFIILILFGITLIFIGYDLNSVFLENKLDIGFFLGIFPALYAIMLWPLSRGISASFYTPIIITSVILISIKVFVTFFNIRGCEFDILKPG